MSEDELPSTATESDTLTATRKQSRWNLFIDNDPVNLMNYVVRIIRKVFGYDQTKANDIMLKVHHNGKALVWSGGKDRAEAYLEALQKAQLSCHLEEASDE